MPSTATITFLLTDVESSTRLWEADADAMSEAMVVHDRVISAAVGSAGGRLIKARGEGDSTFGVFHSAHAAVAAALQAQIRLGAETWPGPQPVRVRMALHTGTAEERHGDFYGPAVNRCARLRSIAHGGQVLVSGATAALVARDLPERATLRDLGVHPLPDLGTPEHVHQLAHPALTADFPPLRTAEVRRELPLPLTSFVGEGRVASVLDRLADSRLVTLVGPGGIGKTRLAVETAAAFDDGNVWFVDLGLLPKTGDVWGAVAAAMHTQERPGTPPSEAVIEGLRAAPALLLLDNCETVVEQAAAVVVEILREGPDVRVIATSRRALDVRGETLVEVPPLDVGAASSDAVRLFRERAAQAYPAFAPTPADVEVIARICRTVDGLPLAIELAAAWVRVLSVTEIAQRLDDRFRLLVSPSGTSLRATVDSSYDLLDPPRRELFARLSVFAGGFTLDAAEIVTGADAFEGIGALVDASLLGADRSAPVTRFRMLETIRVYAASKLEASGESDDVRARHLDWCAGVVARHTPPPGSEDAGAELDAIEEVHDDVRAALRWAVATGRTNEGLRLAWDLRRFWLARSHWTQGNEHLRALLSAARDVEPSLRAQALLALAALEQARGNHQEALRAATEADETSRASGDRRVLAESQLRLGHLAHASGDLESADRFYSGALALARESTHDDQAIDALNGLGVVHLTRGDYSGARNLLMESLDVQKLLGYRPLAVTLFNLGSVAVAQGHHDQARFHFEECLALARQSGNRRMEAAALEGLGRLDDAAGDTSSARERFEEVLGIERKLGDPRGIATSLYALGAVLRRTGDRAAASESLSEAARIAADTNARPLQAAIGHELGRLALDAGDATRAGDLLVEALTTMREIGYRRGIAACLESLGQARARAQPHEAVRLLAAAETLRDEIGAPLDASDLPDHESALAALHDSLAPVDFTSAWDEARNTPVDRIVAELTG